MKETLIVIGFIYKHNILNQIHYSFKRERKNLISSISLLNFVYYELDRCICFNKWTIYNFYLENVKNKFHFMVIRVFLTRSLEQSDLFISYNFRFVESFHDKHSNNLVPILGSWNRSFPGILYILLELISVVHILHFSLKPLADIVHSRIMNTYWKTDIGFSIIVNSQYVTSRFSLHFTAIDMIVKYQCYFSIPFYTGKMSIPDQTMNSFNSQIFKRPRQLFLSLRGPSPSSLQDQLQIAQSPHFGP